MRTPNRIFLGKDDPSRITLEQVFPVGDIVFSTPFVNEPVKYQRVLVEGSCGYLEYFDTFARSLLERETDHLGRWTGMDQYHSDSDMVLIYEPTCSQQMRSVRLLIFVLRADLIQACHLKLSPSSLVIGTFNQVEFLHKQVPLPDGIGNGYIDMAPLIIVPTKNKRGWII